MVDIKNIRKSICDIGKLLYDRELTDSSGGNISVRDGDKIYISPRRSGTDHQWSIKEDSIIVTDLCKIPIMGKAENISREASSHYCIYQNFPDLGAVIHAHPIQIMSFGAAHMDLPAVSEGTRAVLGEQPITNISEALPGSAKQGEDIVENFKNRRKIDPTAPLICSLPFHGTFAAGPNLNETFLYTEVANNCAKILIYRQIMFSGNPDADFSIHRHFTKEEIASIDATKEVCKPGYVYRGAFGDVATYNGRQSGDSKFDKNLVEEITEKIIKQLKK
jgi:L-fuculose-phosphate aldolase